MKRNLFYKLFLSAALALAILPVLFLIGCTSLQKDPSNPNDPGTWSANVPAISNAVAKAQSLNQMLVPPPYQPIGAEAIAAIGALATAISGGVAFLKNKKAKRLSAVNASLATGVKSGQNASALLADAAHSPHFADLAAAINSAPSVNPNRTPG